MYPFFYLANLNFCIMKKEKLLFSVVAMFFAVSSVAQQNVTPSRWKFSEMPIGSAKSLFLVEGASGKGNLQYKSGEGFRLADDLDGAIVTASSGANAPNNYAEMTDEQRKIFSDFYEACQIIDGGTLGNLFCYQGKESTASDARITKATGSFGGAAMYFLTKKDGMSPGIYRVTIDIRVISNAGVDITDLSTGAGGISVYVANSWYDPMKYAGADIQFDAAGKDSNMKFYSNFNDYWQTYQFEVNMVNIEDHETFPGVFKLGFGKWFDNAIVLMRDLKIEKVDAPTLGGEAKLYGKYNLDWSDAPSGVNLSYSNNEVIVYTVDNSISVLDAKSTIEVYTVTGELVRKVEPISTFTSIPALQKGAYIVKVGKTVKKVVL